MNFLNRFYVFAIFVQCSVAISFGESPSAKRELAEADIEGLKVLMTESIEREIPAAKEKGRSATTENIESIIELSVALIAEHSDDEFPFVRYTAYDKSFPEGWEFLEPKALDVGSDYVEVWLYRNAMNNLLPQVYFRVRKEKEIVHVEYFEELHTEPLKTWIKNGSQPAVIVNGEAAPRRD